MLFLLSFKALLTFLLKKYGQICDTSLDTTENRKSFVVCSSPLFYKELSQSFLTVIGVITFFGLLVLKMIFQSSVIFSSVLVRMLIFVEFLC